MKELGFTKGGFYRHFESKGDLYAAAVTRAFEEQSNRMVAMESCPERRWVAGSNLSTILVRNT